MTTMIEGQAVEQVTAFLVPADVLRELSAAAVAASTDTITPTLMSVRLEWGEEGIDAIATDRFRLAHVYWNGTHPHWSGPMMGTRVRGFAVLPAKELAAYVKSLPKASRRNAPALVAIRPEADRVTFTCHTGDGEVSRVILTIQNDYPKWQTLIPSEWKELPVEGIAMNPDYVADVARMPLRKNGSVRVRFVGSTRPMLWSGESELVQWEYLLMPIRQEA